MVACYRRFPLDCVREAPSFRPLGKISQSNGGRQTLPGYDCRQRVPAHRQPAR